MNCVSKETRRECFEQAGVKNPKRNQRVNLHHICFKSDYKRGLLPRDFNVNQRSNLIPLEIEVHNELHKIIDNNPRYRNDISLRVYFANMAFCGDLSDVPERLYLVSPEKIMKRKK